MSEQPPDRPSAARSFAGVADAYDRARPSYPEDAVAWLAGGGAATVLELGAGTGKLTTDLASRGHRVIATDPLAPMLDRLVRSAPAALPVRAVAERIPVRTRSVDVVVSAQAYHWFDLDRALPEIARVLRPGGRVALAWNERDERVPWVRRLGEIIGTPEQGSDPTQTLLSSKLFGYVDQATFRIWQTLERDGLRDLVSSRSNIAVMDATERDHVLAKVDALYDGYGRGADGMRLPYLTRCYSAVVRPRSADDDGYPPTDPRDPGEDTDALLIDFQ
jgi:SAM-dependent methyltransferase